MRLKLALQINGNKQLQLSIFCRNL